MPRILVKDRGVFSAEPTETILAAGQRAGFSFPVACRNGVCEKCLGTLLAGSVQVQRKGHIIHAGEPGSERVLYCVALPLADCEIQVPDVRAPGELPVHEVSCQIIEITDLNTDVSRVLLRLPAGKRIHWYAGQYLELLLPRVGDSAFSIANAPGGRDIELHVRYHRENSASLEVMHILRTEPTVRVRLPGGSRYLDKLPDRPVWFICGSTGFAPVKAMIEFLRNEGFSKPVHLYWGARTRSDLYLEQTARDLAAEMPNLKLVLALSDESHTGYSNGLVHEAALADHPETEKPAIYVGGSPPMAWAVFDALVAAGVPARDIHSDVYDYAPR